VSSAIDTRFSKALFFKKGVGRHKRRIKVFCLYCGNKQEDLLGAGGLNHVAIKEHEPLDEAHAEMIKIGGFIVEFPIISISCLLRL
jgi:hypothetical protein